MKIIRRYHNGKYGKIYLSVLEKISKNTFRTVHTKAIKRYIYSSGVSFFSLYPEIKLHAGLKEKHRKKLDFLFFLIKINL